MSECFLIRSRGQHVAEEVLRWWTLQWVADCIMVLQGQTNAAAHSHGQSLSCGQPAGGCTGQQRLADGRGDKGAQEGGAQAQREQCAIKCAKQCVLSCLCLYISYAQGEAAEHPPTPSSLRFCRKRHKLYCFWVSTADVCGALLAPRPPLSYSASCPPEQNTTAAPHSLWGAVVHGQEVGWHFTGPTKPTRHHPRKPGSCPDTRKHTQASMQHACAAYTTKVSLPGSKD